jgi:hypothetical protein
VNGPETSTSQDCLVSWARQAGGVALVVAASFLLVTAPVAWLQGRAGLAAAGIAALVCAMSAISAQFTAIRLAGLGRPVQAALLAMLLRMAPPLVYCLAVGWRHGPEGGAGVVFYVIGFYMVVLAADTCLSVRRVPRITSSRRG